MAEKAGQTNPRVWARLHMRTERARRLDFTTRPYLLQLYEDTCPRIVLMSRAQAGKTVWACSKVFWHAAEHQASAIYTMPTQGEIYEFAKARAKPMIQASPYLSGLIADIDNAGIKRFTNGAAVYFRGTHSEKQALQVPASVLVYDELDRSNQEHREIYEDRLLAATEKYEYFLSTPTVPKYGIHAEYLNSTQYEWVWACGECGEEQVWAPADRSVSWEAGFDFDRPAFACRACGATVEREWIIGGHWESFGNPRAPSHGYHITAILPPESTAADLVARLNRATYIERFVQGHIGLPATSAQGELPADIFQWGEWSNASSSEVETAAGLDVGKELNLMVCEAKGDGPRRIVAVHHIESRDWAQIHSLMNTLNIRWLVADMLPETSKVQELVAAFPGRVLMADYSLGKVSGDEAWVVEEDKARVRIARTPALDHTRDRLLMKQDVFPSLPPDLQRSFEAQMTAPKRGMTTNSQGQDVAEWVETGPDHDRHAHLYMTVAAAVAQGEYTDIWAAVI